MTSHPPLAYAFAISLPPADDARLRAWAAATPGATWDDYGGHVTLVRLAGSLAPDVVAARMREACAGAETFEAAFTRPIRQSYWDKPGLEIVMLVAEREADTAGVLHLRERLLTSLSALGLELAEGGPYVPHVTLTTGLPAAEAGVLESAAAGLDLRFTAREIMFWCGGETADPDAEADPPWRIIERLQLGRPG
jgi:2'-5' RNA ligase